MRKRSMWLCLDVPRGPNAHSSFTVVFLPISLLFLQLSLNKDIGSVLLIKCRVCRLSIIYKQNYLQSCLWLYCGIFSCSKIFASTFLPPFYIYLLWGWSLHTLWKYEEVIRHGSLLSSPKSGGQAQVVSHGVKYLL